MTFPLRRLLLLLVPLVLAAAFAVPAAFAETDTASLCATARSGETCGPATGAGRPAAATR